MKKKPDQFLLNSRFRWSDRLFLLLIVFTVVQYSVNLYASEPLQQENKEITGKVIEALTGNPLPGVSILIKGTTEGTITDIEGNYSIMASSDDILIFSSIGYRDEEVSIDDRTIIDISLSEDLIDLDEVIVTGYGVQRKSDVTGSIASVSSKKLSEIPVSGIDHALQGRAAGVNIIPKSGRPGEGATIQIRGITSINGIEPLVIVDGVAFGTEILTQLNANDIESIEILKDASSAAIYGASGGNGVIILTTKKGHSGKIMTDFNFYTGIEMPSRSIDLMNSQEWLQTYEEVTNSDTALTAQPDTLPTYDWQNYVFEPAYSQNYELSFRGGSENSSFLVSASYNDQNGIIRNSGYSRVNLRVNSEHKINKWLTIDEKIFYVNTINEGFNDHLWHEYYDGPIRPSFQMIPLVPDYLPNGDWANPEDYNVPATGDNPLAKLDMIDRTERHNLFSANLGATLKIMTGLTFTSRFDGRMNFIEWKEFQDAYENTIIDRRGENEIKLIGGMRKYKSYIAQQVLTYNFDINYTHNISVMLGTEAYEQQSYSMEGERNSYSVNSSNLLYFDNSEDNESSNQIIGGDQSKERALSYFGRVNYNYDEKYLFTANIRRDGRNSFGPENRIGYFPSFSVGWKFSEEEFMDSQRIINFGKIRFGYGESGAYPRSGTPYLSTIQRVPFFSYPFNGTTSSLGAAPVTLENKEIHWESIVTQNLGIDLTMFNNRVSFTAEYFVKINDGMIMTRNVPYIAGTFQMLSSLEGGNYTNPEVNIGSIKNSGFEFTLGYKKSLGGFRSSFDLNFSTLKNEVLDLASDSIRDGSVHNITPITMTYIGGSVSEFHGWEIDGIFRSQDEIDSYVNENQELYQPNAEPGDARFKDVNNDGKVLTNDDKVKLGSPLPKFVFGFSMNLEYKNFDFSAFFNGTWGNKIFNGTKQYLYYYQGTYNHAKAFTDRFIAEDIIKIDPSTGTNKIVVPANTDTDLWRNASTNYAKPTDFYIEDGSYIRLRNITLGYTIPKEITEKINISRFRVYASAKNLFTITKYTGMDPESGFYDDLQVLGVDVGVYPSTKMYLIGANLTF